PRQLKRLHVEDYSQENDVPKLQKCKELAVKIGNIESFQVVKDHCDTIIVGLEKYKEINSGFNLKEIIDLLAVVKDLEINLKIETPRIVTQKNWETIESLSVLKEYSDDISVIVNDLGSFKYLKNQ